MNNNVRVTSDENIVRDAKVEVRVTEDGEDRWVDISPAVKEIHPYLVVGELARVRLQLFPVETKISGKLTETTLVAFGKVLEACGWSVEPPAA